MYMMLSMLSRKFKKKIQQTDDTEWRKTIKKMTKRVTKKGRK